MDQWHGILIGAVSTLSGVVAVLWKQTNSLRSQLDVLHDEHKGDIRELMQSSIELGLSVVARARPRVGSGRSQPPSAPGSQRDEPSG
jgi:hypothetical protein